MGTPSNRQLNWTSVSFTPSGGTLIPITEVQDVKFDVAGEVREGRGDGDYYASAVNVVGAKPTAEITTQFITKINTITIGSKGGIAAKHNDYDNGSGSGSIAYVMSPCVVTANSRSGAHMQIGQGTISFQGYAVDGVTNPLSATVTP
jgi:hypothetical protein